MIDHWILTLLIFAPLIGAFLVIELRDQSPRFVRGVAIAFGIISLVLSLWLAANFDSDSPALQFNQVASWLHFGPHQDLNYHVGVDGLGLIVVLLTAIIFPIAQLASGKIEKNVAAYHALLLLLQGCAFGVFVMQDFFLWFLFWEISLFPTFFLIREWGGPGGRKAAWQFFIYTLAGSAFLLLGYLGVFVRLTSLRTDIAWSVFDFQNLSRLTEIQALRPIDFVLTSVTSTGHEVANTDFSILFLILAVGVIAGFAVKVPLFPFHTWLPNAYAEAPAPVSMVLTGVLSKMGVYGFLRIALPLFRPEIAAISNVLLGLAVAGAIFSAAAALSQRDLKRMAAYLSINHLSYCLIGIFAVTRVTSGGATLNAAMDGVLLQIFSHGITAAALFYFIGLMEERTGNRGLADFGGLRAQAPTFTAAFCLIAFASLGLPGMSGFIAEFLILKGSFALAPVATIGASIAIFIGAVVLIRVMKAVFHGPLKEGLSGFQDLTPMEIITSAPLIVLTLAVGLWPQLILELANPFCKTFTDIVAETVVKR